MSAAPRVSVRVLSPHELAEWGPRVQELERGVDYPLGDDRFAIDHGADYFAFFRRLGELRYLVATLDGEPVGVLAAVRRTIAGAGAWYLCDLKAARRGRGLTVARLFSCLRERGDVTRGYGISMNPAGAAPNRVLGLAQRLGGDAVRAGPMLHLYSLDAGAMTALTPMLVEARGPVSFLSLRGCKDIVLASTGAAMPLLHLQHGPCAATGVKASVPGHVHMFCTPAGDALDLATQRAGHAPGATATVLHAGMDGVDWAFVLTSDI